jgi:hypothetical protein
VHLFSDSTAETVFANRHYLMIAAGPDGATRTLRLPRRSTVTDLQSGAIVATDADRFSVSLLPKEVRLFFMK